MGTDSAPVAKPRRQNLDGASHDNRLFVEATFWVGTHRVPHGPI